jgi:hypothetical protein
MDSLKNKIALIQSYLDKLEQCINKEDPFQAKELELEIVSVFDNEIENIRGGLDNYSYVISLSTNSDVNYLGDAKLLKAKLYNYKLNLESGLTKSQKAENNVSVVQTLNNEATISISVSLDMTVELINELPESILNDEEKEILSGKLANISAEKDKSKRWEKVGNALKWIADKSVEVGKAALPYIIKAIAEGN